MGQTACTVASVLVLLFVLMYVFAVLGFCLFGVPESADLNNWGNLALAFFTLFSLATVPCLGAAVGAGDLRRDWQLVWACGHAGPHLGAFSMFRHLAGLGKLGAGLLGLRIGQCPGHKIISNLVTP